MSTAGTWFDLVPRRHTVAIPDCTIVGYKCNCPQCQVPPSPMRRAPEPAATALDDEPTTTGVTTGVTVAIPDTLVDFDSCPPDWTSPLDFDTRADTALDDGIDQHMRNQIEALADNAGIPASAAAERAASSTTKGAPKGVRTVSYTHLRAHET